MQSQHRNGDEIISAISAIKHIHTSLSAAKISATFELIHNSKVLHYWLQHQSPVNSKCKETATQRWPLCLPAAIQCVAWSGA